MTLPPPIAAYFTADAADDAVALTRIFAHDAVVRDEGHTHTGPVAISAWWAAAKARYHHHAEPVEARHDGDAVTVRARVTGSFPGSPAILTFDFVLAGDLISQLRIH